MIFQKNILVILFIGAMVYETQSLSLEKRRLGLQNPPLLAEIQGLEKIAKTNSGVFTTIHGNLISTLVADADPCRRYPLIDQIVTICRANNCLKEGIEIANRVAALEKNTNIFFADKAPPAFCNDPALPASPELRCVVPVIDPAFPGAAEFNAKVTSRLNQIQSSPGGNPRLCAGLSIQQQAIALGVSCCRGDGCNKATGPPVTPPATPIKKSPAPVPQKDTAPTSTPGPAPVPQKDTAPTSTPGPAPENNPASAPKPLPAANPVSKKCKAKNN